METEDVLPGQQYGVTVEWWLAGRNWDTKSEGELRWETLGL